MTFILPQHSFIIIGQEILYPEMQIKKLQLHSSTEFRSPRSVKRLSFSVSKNPKNAKFVLTRTKKSDLQILQKITNSLQQSFKQQNKQSESTGTPIYSDSIKINLPMQKSNLFQFPTGRRLTPRSSENSKNTLQAKYDQLMDKIRDQLPFSKPSPMIGIFNKIKTSQRQHIVNIKERRSLKREQIDPYTRREYRHVKMDSINNWNKQDPIKVNRVLNISKPCQINSMTFSYRDNRLKEQKASSFTKTHRPFSSCEYKRSQSVKVKRYDRNPSETGLLNQLKPWQEVKEQIDFNF